MSVIVGVDGGGTKTKAAVVDESGRVLGTGAGGPANARSAGAEVAAESIASAIAGALHAAGLALADLAAVCACLAGLDTELDLPVPRLALQRLGFSGPAILENDAVGAWTAATNGKPGVVVIAGTGSTALGMNAHGAFWRSGGWDYVLSDDGSGYAIGREGIRTAMRALDGRGEPTLLARELRARFGVEDGEDMRRLVDSSPFGKFEMASFAIHVARAAEAGDPAARAILAQAGHDLAVHATAIIRQLGMGGESFPVGTIGGVFKSVPFVTEPFAKDVLAAAPHAEIRVPEQPPEVSAAMLGWQRLRAGDIGSWSLGGGGRSIPRGHSVAQVGRLP